MITGTRRRQIPAVDLVRTDPEFTMSLAIPHPGIDPARITHELGLQPGHVWCGGEQRTEMASVVQYRIQGVIAAARPALVT